jgi:hypothetical protein
MDESVKVVDGTMTVNAIDATAAQIEVTESCSAPEGTAALILDADSDKDDDYERRRQR